MQSPDGLHGLGGGFTGAALVNERHPIAALSLERDANGSYCLGEVVDRASRVDVHYSTGQVGQATVLTTSFAVNLWIAFAAGDVEITTIRAFDSAGGELTSLALPVLI